MKTNILLLPELPCDHLQTQALGLHPSLCKYLLQSLIQPLCSLCTQKPDPTARAGLGKPTSQHAKWKPGQATLLLRSQGLWLLCHASRLQQCQEEEGRWAHFVAGQGKGRVEIFPFFGVHQPSQPWPATPAPWLARTCSNSGASGSSSA